MLYILNSLPNSILVPLPGGKREIVGLSEKGAIALLNEEVWVSAIGHQSTADVLSKRLNSSIPFNRVQVSPVHGDTLLVAAFTPNRRLNEGELFTEEEVLGFEIRYCKIEF